MTENDLQSMRERHERVMQTARESQMDYCDGVQCLLDRAELLAEVTRLRKHVDDPAKRDGLDRYSCSPFNV